MTMSLRKKENKKRKRKNKSRLNTQVFNMLKEMIDKKIDKKIAMDVSEKEWIILLIDWLINTYTGLEEGIIGY